MAIYTFPKLFSGSPSLCHMVTLAEAEMITLGLQLGDQIQRWSVPLARVEATDLNLVLGLFVQCSSYSANCFSDLCTKSLEVRLGQESAVVRSRPHLQGAQERSFLGGQAGSCP